MPKYQQSQHIWKVIRQVDGYYYELRVGGIVIARYKLTDDELSTYYDLMA